MDLSSITLSDLYDDSTLDEDEDVVKAPSLSSLSSGAENTDDDDDTTTKDGEDSEGGTVEHGTDALESSFLTELIISIIVL